MFDAISLVLLEPYLKCS